MDIKVYKKEEIRQPSGYEYVYTPDVIDIVPDIIETESSDDITDGVWTLDKLKRVADVRIEGNKLIINSSDVKVENGRLIVHTTDENITGCDVLDDREALEQQCALATIFQKGLDPLDIEDGIRWSEAILEELSGLQLIQDIIDAVAKVTTSIVVTFDTITDDEGQEYLSYKLTEVA